MRPRYAIYFAPRPEDALGLKVSHWLGRDAISGNSLSRFVPDTLSDIDLDALTASPRHYGFHATLKAPFELHATKSQDELIEALATFCQERQSFDVELEVNALSVFVAVRLARPSDALEALAKACVIDFEAFRAPLSDQDIARRRRANLTAVQDAHLLQYGYPYIFDDFRFHMTLTGSIAEESLRARVVAALRDHFEGDLGVSEVWGLSLFKQLDRQSDFTIIAQIPFS